ncbi:MAG: MotA/TolQ/ExbB proton channel family protein [Phycisphaeraceae bacterium]|nr:MotA/TolQ/ExbB proton channel family protein [Phycisphaeraceae bacterium]
MADLWASFLSSMQRGGFVMWPLLAMSIAMVAIVLERAWFWLSLHGRKGRARFARLVDALRRGQRERVMAMRAERLDPYTEMAAELVRLGPTESNAVAISEEERPRFDRFLGTLGTIVTAAPLLGILGTVSGISKSIAMLGGRATADMSGVSQGIAEALVTTATGLSLALLTLLPYMIFRTHADRAVGRMETLIAAAQGGALGTTPSNEGNHDADARSRRPLAGTTG